MSQKAFLVAISNYRDKSLFLPKGMIGDVRKLSMFLRSPVGAMMSKDDVVVLPNRLATRDQILDRLESIAAIDSLEKCLFYFSGHGGLIDKDNSTSGCILPWDATRSEDGVLDINSVITFQDLTEKLDKIRTKKLVLILDCCHAAAVGLGSKAIAWSVSSTGFSSDLLDRAVRSLGDGRAILSSCKQDQSSYVSANGESYFTSALLSGLTGKCKHFHGEVSVSDLAKYIKESVEKETVKAQEPQSYVVNDFPIVKLAIPECPYPGWEPYDGKNSVHPFCGRDKEEKALIAATTNPGCTVIIGGSGVGKSSLVRAGLIPKLAGRGIESFTTRPSSGDIERQLERLSETKRELLFIDQFEEFFALNVKQQEKLDECLSNSAGNGKIRLLLAVRGDVYSELIETRIWEKSSRFDLHSLKREQLKEVISRPARDCGVKMTEALITQLVEDLREEKGALPLLQAVLERLWATLEPGQNEITLTTYETYLCERKDEKRISGIVRTLSQRADEVYNDHLKNEDERRIARSIFLKLIHFLPAHGVVRWQLSRSELAEGLVSVPIRSELENQPFGIVLNKLLKGRLITFEEDETTSKTSSNLPKEEASERVDGTYSVTHEALIHHWPPYQTWITKFRQNEIDRLWLESRADTWIQNKKKDTHLLSKTELIRANSSLTHEYATWIKPSVEAEELINKSRLKVRTEKVQSAIAISMFIGIAILAIWQVLKAIDAGNHAKTSQLITRASEQIQLHPHVALVLLIDAMRREPSSIEASRLLRVCIDRLATHWHQIREPSKVVSLAVNEPGTKLFVLTELDGVHLVDIENKKIASDRKFDLGNVSVSENNEIIASPDGNWFCCYGSGRLKVFQTDSSIPAIDIPASIQAVAFSPDSCSFSFADFENVHLYRLGKSAQEVCAFKTPVRIRSLGIGKRRVVGIAKDSIYVYDIASRKVKELLSAQFEKVCVSENDDFALYSQEVLGIMRSNALEPRLADIDIRDSEPIFFANFTGRNRVVVRTSLKEITLDVDGNVLFTDHLVQDSEQQKFTIDNDRLSLLRTEPLYFGKNIAAEKLVATISDNSTVTLWDSPRPENNITDTGGARIFENRYLLAPSKNNGLRLFDLETGTMRWRLGFERNFSFHGVVSNTYNFIAIPLRNEVVDSGGKTILKFNNRSGFEPVFSKDDAEFLSSKREFEVEVHSLKNGTSKTYSCPIEWKIVAAKFSDVEPNKIIIQLNSEDESILQFLDVENPTIVIKPPRHLSFKRSSVALLNDRFYGTDAIQDSLIDDTLKKEKIIKFPARPTKGSYRTVRAHDHIFSLGEELWMLNLQDRPLHWKNLEAPSRVENLTESSDGRYVMTQGENILIFEPTKSNHPVVAVDGMFVTACCFVGDGREILIARHSTVKRIKWRVDDLLEEARAVAIRNLTHLEWATFQGSTPYRRIIEELPEVTFVKQ